MTYLLTVHVEMSVSLLTYLLSKKFYTRRLKLYVVPCREHSSVTRVTWVVPESELNGSGPSVDRVGSWFYFGPMGTIIWY